MSASPFQLGGHDVNGGAASPASRIVADTCSSCFGRGLKYQHDFYGNPVSVLCATCAGRGIVAYELPASPPPAPVTAADPSGSEPTVHLCSGCRGSGIQHQSLTIQCLVPYGQYCHFCGLCAQCGGQGVVSFPPEY